MEQNAIEEYNYFSELYAINVGDKIEKKNSLSYLSWAWAWAELKKKHPDATYTVYENRDGWSYHTDGKTCWVKTGVTVAGIEHVEYLPVMDHRNNSIPLERVTSTDVNKAIQRSLTKACARHGVGLYIYAGEDLPEGEDAPPVPCSVCGNAIVPVIAKDGRTMQPDEIIATGERRFGRKLCSTCQKKVIAAEKELEKQQQAFDASLSAALPTA
ncbi:MAG: DUF1071 domain-containing protein [Clostridia bacterium]|nr:DUF1071 domain-containing protein [Clostridia bacterium]